MSALRAALRDGRSATGLAILAALAIVAIGAPLLANANPIAQTDVVHTRFLAPLMTGPDGARHLLGTDALGRDVWARLAYGARISLSVGVLAVLVSLLLGAGVGVGAAIWGGVPERALMGVTDAMLALPRLVLLLALVSLWQPSVWLVVLVLGCTGWMSVARLARAEVKGLLARPFVDAARAGGARTGRLVRRHLVPNALTPILVAGALGVGNAIMLEAGLSFLGLGVPAPAPSWGNMIANGRDALVNAWWIATFPGAAVALAVIGCNLLADGLRDALDPTARATPPPPSASPAT